MVRFNSWQNLLTDRSTDPKQNCLLLSVVCCLHHKNQSQQNLPRGSLADEWEGSRDTGIEAVWERKCAEDKLRRKHVNSYADGMRGDYSQSGLCYSHVISTITSEEGRKKKSIRLQSGGHNGNPGFTSLILWINHSTSWCLDFLIYEIWTVVLLVLTHQTP